MFSGRLPFTLACEKSERSCTATPSRCRFDDIVEPTVSCSDIWVAEFVLVSLHKFTPNSLPILWFCLLYTSPSPRD